MPPKLQLTDAHHHLWRYKPEAYPWIGDGMDVLKNDFLAPDFHTVATPANVTRSVVVQTRHDLEETRTLLETAAADPVVDGVVGWLPLTDPAALESALDEFAQNPHFKGVRHLIQDEPDDQFIVRDDFNQGVAQLAHHRLVYDVLIYARHLPQTLQFIDRHPNQSFVIDHLAKPAISASTPDTRWFASIRELARRPNVSAKLSGVVTEVRDPGWSHELIRPYLEAALEAFGPDRLLFGSDWPVCLLKTTYHEWVTTVVDLVSTLSRDEQAQILQHNAEATYQLT